MKKIKFKSYLLQIVVLVAVLLLFTECRNNAQAKKDFSTFVATFVFFIFMIIGGIPAVIFSAISVKSLKSSMKVVAIVFVSIFGVCSLFGVPMYMAFWEDGAKEWISMLVFLQYGTLMLSVILIVLGANNRAKIAQNAPVPVSKPAQPSRPQVQVEDKSDDEIDYLDEMLND